MLFVPIRRGKIHTTVQGSPLDRPRIQPLAGVKAQGRLFEGLVSKA